MIGLTKLEFFSACVIALFGGAASGAAVAWSLRALLGFCGG